MAFTFKGGEHVREYKNTAAVAIKEMPAPQIVTVPLSQHIGAPCTPTVAVGDHVDCGAVIGDVEKGLGCPVHASVSGTVKEIKTITTAQGAKIPAVVIENDGAYTMSADIAPFPKPLAEASADDIVTLVRRAGISGMGGATFPTYAKISSALGRVDTLIINCAECEPFITANHRVMLESPEKILGGAEILRHALGLAVAHIAIEDNKPDAIASMQRAAAGREGVEVMTLRTKYPQGSEKQLIYAVTGREVPSKKLPLDAHVIVLNVGSAKAIADAVIEGKPLIDRVTTVKGCVKEHANLRLRMGTIVADVIGECGGYTEEAGKIVMGGCMTGLCAPNDQVVVTKGSNGILVFNEEDAKGYEENPCIRCGRCVEACPIGLNPYRMKHFCDNGDLKGAEANDLMECILCGSCSYACPAKRWLTASFKSTKEAIMREARRAKK